MPNSYVYKQESATKNGACKNAEGIVMGWFKMAGTNGLSRMVVRDRLSQVPRDIRGSKQDVGRLTNYLLDSLIKNGAIQKLQSIKDDQQSIKDDQQSVKDELQSVKDDLQSTKEELVECRKACDDFEVAMYQAQAAKMGIEDELQVVLGGLQSAKMSSDDFEVAMYQAQAAKMGVEDELQSVKDELKSTKDELQSLEDQMQSLKTETNIMRGLFTLSFIGLVSTSLYIASTLLPMQPQLAIGY